jgi:hypothetical protein
VVTTEGRGIQGDNDRDNATRELVKITQGGTDARGFAGVIGTLASSAKSAGTVAVTSGRWLVDLAIDLAGQLPVRTLEELQAEHPGMSRDELAEELTRDAAKTTGAIGAVAGGLAAASWFAPPTWVAAPLELITETLAVAAVEMRLIGELHSAYGRPLLLIGPERAAALAHAWARGAAVEPEHLTQSPTTADLLTAGAKRQLSRGLRRRLARRAGRNAASLLPFMVGAAAGAKLNHGATSKLGDAVRHDLSR